MLKDWAHGIIKDNKLTNKQYNNMITIIKQCYEYACNEKICDNVWKDVKINRKLLTQSVRKNNESEIYFEEEIKALINLAFEKFYNEKDILALTIPLLFCTGLRAGEIIALKYSDFDEKENVIRISKSEVVQYLYDSDSNNFSYIGRKVDEHTKTLAGTRNIPYCDFAKRIIQLIREESIKCNYYYEDYVFCPNSIRVKEKCINDRLIKYTDELNIKYRSAHKIRKSFLSMLSTSGDIDMVSSIAGHVDKKTTLNSYIFSINKYEVQNSVVNELVNKKIVPLQHDENVGNN